MPAVIFPGPEGRLEGRFQPSIRPRAPVAMILHPHPQGGGTMNDRIVQRLYKALLAWHQSMPPDRGLELGAEAPGQKGRKKNRQNP